MSRPASLAALCLLAMCISISASAGEVIEGRVVAVHDGDTITVRTDDATIRIRLSGIDTPEKGQPWAGRAKAALAGRTFGKEVRVIAVATDAYGRTVGEVYADNVCVGCELVREGHAWVYRRFTEDPVLLQLEAEARANRAGLWALPESQRVPPWEWRRTKTRSTTPKPAKNLSCGTKRYCREMADCAEARFHLEECGLTRLDGDGDGVPCEKLCGRR